MKKTSDFKILLPIVLIVLFYNYGCNKNTSETVTTDSFNQLSVQDQQAFTGMQTAFADAKSYNDSLSHCIGCPLSLRQHYDNLYHHNDSLWYYHNNFYNHGNGYTDHSNNGMSGQHMGDHHNHDYSQGHHYYHHQQMDSLHQAHISHHP